MNKTAFLFLFMIYAFLSAGADPLFIRSEIVMPDGTVYLATNSRGLLSSTDGGTTWIPLHKGLPEKEVYPFTTAELRPLTSCYVDPLHTRRIAVTVSAGVYLSENGGQTWQQLHLGGVVKKTNYITSVALSSVNPRRIVIGTSFNGIFETLNSGETWQRLPLDMKPFYKGAHFYEEITALALNDSDSSLAIACGLDTSLFVSTGGREPIRLALPALEDQHIRSLEWESGTLVLFTDKNMYRYDGKSWTFQPLPVPETVIPPDSAQILRRKEAEGREGIYINSFHASGNALDTLIGVIKAQGFNSMVVDMKDDEGRITYNTALPLPHKTGAVRRRFNLDSLVKRAHSEGIYLIGRIVTFQDPVLYRYRNNAYALWDKEGAKPWGNLVKRTDAATGKEQLVQTEFWVDPFSSFVQDYNKAIAGELQKRGVDEVQFDYIRFPSDGDVHKITYRYQKRGMSRMDALESFVRRVRKDIHIPISTDLYGFNSWYRMGNWIGQDIEMLSRYVDVISPMFYPSHFPAGFEADDDYLAWGEMLYRRGTERARTITGNRVIIRPYIQAFLMGKELSMEKEEYTTYLQREMNGAREGGAEGFTLWNNSNRYYMLQ